MTAEREIRVDKYLWSVRIFKTRSVSIEACKKARIKVNGMPAKSSKIVKKGDQVEVIKPPVHYSYEILDIPKNRVSAKLVPEFLIDNTSDEEKEKLKMADDFFIKRDRGTGRPTKKERRIIDKLKDN